MVRRRADSLHVGHKNGRGCMCYRRHRPLATVSPRDAVGGLPGSRGTHAFAHPLLPLLGHDAHPLKLSAQQGVAATDTGFYPVPRR